MVRELRSNDPQTVERPTPSSDAGSEASGVDARASDWPRIVTRLNEIGRTHDTDQWEIGRLVSEAVNVGAPVTKTGAERAVGALADQTPYYTFATLNLYRKTYTAWLDTEGKLDIVDGVSFGAHQAAMGKEDARGLLKTLVEQVGGDPTRVTVAMTKAASRAEAVARLAAQTKVTAHEPYTPINQHLASILEDIKQIDDVLEELGAPVPETQRKELAKQTTKAIDRLNVQRRKYTNRSKDALAERFLSEAGNPYAADPNARRDYVDEIVTAAARSSGRSRYSNNGTTANAASGTGGAVVESADDGGLW
jgi:hypothetical protein